MNKLIAVTIIVAVNIACFASGYRTGLVRAAKSVPRYVSSEAAAVDHVLRGVTELEDAGASDVCLYRSMLGYRTGGRTHIVYAKPPKQDKL